MLSCLLPNGFLHTPVISGAKYLVLNVTLNLLLHLTAWLTMTFYCWRCAGALDPFYARLSVCFPVSAGFWMAALVVTLAAWRISIRGVLIDQEGGGDKEKQKAYNLPKKIKV